MKVISFTLLSFAFLFSSVSFANGLICQGQGYNVKLYNHVQPTLGTKNPGILVVSSTRLGTITRISDTNIEKYATNTTVSYVGGTRDLKTGRYVSVELTVARQPAASGPFEGQHFARLVIRADQGRFEAHLACAEYLKGQR